MAGYIGSKAVITSGVSASIDELNIIDGVTATTAELNILDGVTSTAAELNILDGVTATTAELNIMDGVTATTAELNIMDGVTSTAAELNIMDGVTATAAEINLIDGGTARGTTAIADGDGVLINDAGTMRQTNVTTLATYMGTKITGGSKVFIASTGVLDGVASVQFRAQDGHFDATKFDHYEFMFQNLIPATDNVELVCQTSTNDGGAYASTNGDYHTGGGSDQIGFLVSENLGSAANEYGVNGSFYLLSPHLTTYTYCNSQVTYVTQNDAIYSMTDDPNSAGARLSNEDTDAVKFIMSSGNIESGEIVMYGIANGS